MLSSYFKDLRAVGAKFEAQKIAFSPLCFWAVDTMLKSGFLKIVESYGENGVCCDELVEKSEFDGYGVNLLSEIALGMGILKLAQNLQNKNTILNSHSNQKAKNAPPPPANSMITNSIL